MEVSHGEVLVTLALEEGETSLKDLQLFPLGEWKHSRGDISITPERARSFAAQHQRRVAGQKVPILWVHSSHTNNPLFGKAAGWITAMRADDKRGVLVDIDFTKAGAKAVADKEFQYLSAEYFDKIQLPHHKQPEVDVITAAALVNSPHLKGMDPILNEETGHLFLVAERQATKTGGGSMDPILLAVATAAGLELSSDVEELTEDEQAKVKIFLEQTAKGPDKVKELETQIKDLAKKLKDKEGPDETEARSLEEAGFKEAATLLSEYRADKMVERISSDLPQGHRLSPVVEEKIRTFAMANDTEKLLEVAQELAAGEGVVNTNEEGGAGGDTGGDDEPATDVGLKLNALADKKAKELELEFSEAYDLIVAENPKLWNEYQGSFGSKSAQVEVV